MSAVVWLLAIAAGIGVAALGTFAVLVWLALGELDRADLDDLDAD